MKKSIALLVALLTAVALTFTACGGKDDEKETTTANNTTTTNRGEVTENSSTQGMLDDISENLSGDMSEAGDDLSRMFN